MAKINKLMVGESLVGEGNEVAHIDLIIGPRGSAAETAFANALTNNKDGFTALLAVVAPNLAVKPSTVMFNKVTIKGAKQAVQMFGPAQYARRQGRRRQRRRWHDPGRRGGRRVHLRRRVHPLGSRGRQEDPGIQLPRDQGIHRARRNGQADAGRSRRAAQFRQAPLRRRVRPSVARRFRSRRARGRPGLPRFLFRSPRAPRWRLDASFLRKFSQIKACFLQIFANFSLVVLSFFNGLGGEKNFLGL